MLNAAGSADPAAESFNYPVAFDLRDLVSLHDVMEELQLGPNGYADSCARSASLLSEHCRSTSLALRRGLLYCMEYLEENLDEWLGEELTARACLLGETPGAWRGAGSEVPARSAGHRLQGTPCTA